MVLMPRASKLWEREESAARVIRYFSTSSDRVRELKWVVSWSTNDGGSSTAT
jgi:hypothetical protein